MVSSRKLDVQVLRQLEPLASFSDARLAELAELCVLEAVLSGEDPFIVHGLAGQSVYLVRGELALQHGDGRLVSVVGGSKAARYPLGKHGDVFASARAATDVELVRIDDDLLDVMATWDALGGGDKGSGSAGSGSVVPASGVLKPAKGAVLTRIFGSGSFRYGAFVQLPGAHIQELFSRFARIGVQAGDVVINAGDDGDYYYVIEEGTFRVSRSVEGVTVTLAELHSGDAFGEEALVSDAKRNATVAALTEGTLLRLSKQDFMNLLRKPLLHRINLDEARQKVASGGQWIDVRLSAEALNDRLPGALNIPLADIRNAFENLDRDREYIVYCQSERRSSAATFLLAQHGYKAYLLQGGLNGGEGQT